MKPSKLKHHRHICTSELSRNYWLGTDFWRGRRHRNHHHLTAWLFHVSFETNEWKVKYSKYQAQMGGRWWDNVWHRWRSNNCSEYHWGGFGVSIWFLYSYHQNHHSYENFLELFNLWHQMYHKYLYLILKRRKLGYDLRKGDAVLNNFELKKINGEPEEVTTISSNTNTYDYFHIVL